MKARFFSVDVYRVWQRCAEAEDSFIPDNISVVTDFTSDWDISEGMEQDPLKRLDVINRELREYMEKAQFLVDAGDRINCGVCHRRVNWKDDHVVICSQGSCRCASHLLCLSAVMIPTKYADTEFIPKGGECPECHDLLDWPTLMKEMTSRVRGSELKRSRNQKNLTHLPSDLEDLEEECSFDEDEYDAASLVNGEKDLFPPTEQLHVDISSKQTLRDIERGSEVNRESKSRKPIAIDIDDESGCDDIYLVE